MIRRLDPDEASVGVHTLEAVADDGTVLGRYECPCQWCDIWRAAKPVMDRAIADMEQSLGLERRPDWLGG